MEYVYNTDGTITVTTYVDGTAVLTSNNKYVSNADAFTADIVDTFCMNFSGSGTGTVYVDNVKVYQEVVDLGAAE